MMMMPGVSTADHLKLEHMEPCKCGSQQVVMFVCLTQACPDRAKQPLFCAICAKNRHDHRSVLIANELVNMQQKWAALK